MNESASRPNDPCADAPAEDAAPSTSRAGGLPDQQAAGAVLMIRPRRFGSNAETLDSNRFQSRQDGDEVAAEARKEFDALADALERAGVTVHALDGRDAPLCPDEVFPNNWISTHADGTIVLYPMMARSRRLERRRDAIDRLRAEGYAVEQVVDLTELEPRGLFLEGTGSLVLDRPARAAYACVSARTSPDAVRIFADRLEYEPVVFDAGDREGHPIYHTNVLMSVGTSFAVVCVAAISNGEDRGRVLERLRASGKEVIELEQTQVAAFAGNLLELRGAGRPVIALSRRALASLGPAQRDALAAHGDVVPVDVPVIETFGGGSVRCMLAEVHLPREG